MKILKAKHIIYGKNLEILDDKAIAFDEKIVAVDDFSVLKNSFKNAKILELKNAVIAPAFVNSHVHLEFSANKSTLSYGDFITWLGSVIKNSKFLAQKCTDFVQKRAILSMLKGGTAAVGAVSSFGVDTKILSASPLRVVHFNEILGSNADFIEQNFNAFLKRFSESKRCENSRFKSAISIHSPYSIHKDLAKKAINFAKENSLLISTHFLESKHEKEWLENGSGAFRAHLENFIKEPKPQFNPSEFLGLFSGLDTLFTHCVWVSDFSDFKPNHSVTHCPSSNRLLGDKALNLAEILRQKVALNIGTDGLSSNLSLNMFDELRNAIFTHQNINLHELYKILFSAATLGGARALGLDSGEIGVGKNADIMVISALNCDKNELLTQLLLHTKSVKQLYIGGKICKF